MNYYGQFSYARVKDIIKYTDSSLHNKNISELQHMKVGYYHPSYANWNYDVYIICKNNRLYMVVGTFGHILTKDNLQ